MESSVEWYQLLGTYVVGIALAVTWYQFSTETKKILSIHPYVLAILVVISGCIGMLLFGEPHPTHDASKEINLWQELWDLLLTAPLDLIASFIVLVVFYMLFAIVPFTFIILGITLCKWFKNPETFS